MESPTGTAEAPGGCPAKHPLGVTGVDEAAKKSYYQAVNDSLAPAWSALPEAERERWRAGVGVTPSIGDVLGGLPAGTFRAARPDAVVESERRKDDPAYRRMLGFGKLLLWSAMDIVGGHLATPAERAALDAEKRRAAAEFKGAVA